MDDINEAIRASAMLAGFHTTAWYARKKDPDGAAVAAKAVGANPAAYSAHRNLMFGADTRLKAAHNIQQQGRRIYIDATLPWGDEAVGVRMLPTINWLEFMKAMAGIATRFQAAVDELVDHYDEDVGVAMQELKLTTTAGLYPLKENIAAFFSMKPTFSPIPEGHQFKGLPPAVLTRLGDVYEGRLTKQMRAATDVSIRRAVDTMRVFAERMDSSKVYDSSWDMVVALPGMLDAFNVARDPRATRAASIIRSDILGAYTLAALRAGPTVREAVKSSALRVAATIETIVEEEIEE